MSLGMAVEAAKKRCRRVAAATDGTRMREAICKADAAEQVSPLLGFTGKRTARVTPRQNLINRTIAAKWRDAWNAS